jgi:hypothetical protein
MIIGIPFVLKGCKEEDIPENFQESWEKNRWNEVHVIQSTVNSFILTVTLGVIRDRSLFINLHYFAHFGK